ncbi:MAG TPA: polyphenol oxidase family protein [Ktedonobacterales bacterium]|nr:polyphenol oxidase family protein [Ktedonobacterales bacterium]
MIQRQDGDIVWFQFASLSAQDDLVTHGVFARHGGASAAPLESLNAGPTTPDDPAARSENYRRIGAALPGHPLLVGTKPLQGTTVREVVAADVRAQEPPAVILPGGGDAFITQVHGIGLFWAVADCSAILLVDRAHRAIGLAHAGWRGTSGAILRNTLDAMRARYGTEPADLLAAIAPTIGPCCYEVDEPVRQAFASDPLTQRAARFSTITVPAEDGGERESLRLDLAASNRAQMLELGIPEAQIETSDLCPGSHTEIFFSHRMEGGRTGRFAVVLGLL